MTKEKSEQGDSQAEISSTIPRNYDALPILRNPPNNGTAIAYKVIFSFLHPER